MKKTITAGPTPQVWDPKALYVKAERYVQQMAAHSSDDWEYALWSSLALELLARAALANVSPALLADDDKQSFSSLSHALGFPSTEEKFSPKSIAISEVFKRLTMFIPGFAKEHASFGTQHTGRRNEELHSGKPAFDGLKASTWQPRFYDVCQLLLTSLGLTLADFLGKNEADVAAKLIEAAADESAKAVRGDVEAHKKVWLAKDDKEQAKLQSQAAVWANRQAGHRVECPACTSQALVVGEPISAPVQKLNVDEITETQEFLPNQFECVACGLRIAGLSRLSAVGLGDKYKKTRKYDAAEYYAPNDDYAEFEDDNNER